MDTNPSMEQGRQPRPRVVVIGGGFAGMSAVRELSVADVDVLLLDQHGYNTFQPLLYQVATGGLNPGDVTYPLRAFTSRYRNASFRRAKVTGLDLQAKRVLTATGNPVEYDYLIICAGVAANFFGTPGADENALVMYSRAGALHVRDKLMTSIEDAAQKLKGAPEPVVVVVGAGATGVEMAGALAELRNTAVPVAYPELSFSRVRVILVEMGDKVLAPFAPKLRDYTEKELRERGVDLRLRTAVKEVRPHSVLLADGDQVPTAGTVWAAGVSAAPVTEGWSLPTGKSGRVKVRDDLRVEGYDNVFAVGDVAINEDDPLPQLAQPAIQGGRHAAVQIRRMLAGSPTEPFHYKDKGIMATIGRSDAVVQLPSGIKLKGFIAWIAWVLLHIVTLVGNRNRIATMANLSVRYLAWPGALNLIVGDDPSE
ncbi:MAG: NAD(P)/FAD-dependent oxidoreductase [Actinomycetes bacterium]